MISIRNMKPQKRSLVRGNPEFNQRILQKYAFVRSNYLGHLALVFKEDAEVEWQQQHVHLNQIFIQLRWQWQGLAQQLLRRVMQQNTFLPLQKKVEQHHTLLALESRESQVRVQGQGTVLLKHEHSQSWQRIIQQQAEFFKLFRYLIEERDSLLTRQLSFYQPVPQIGFLLTRQHDQPLKALSRSISQQVQELSNYLYVYHQILRQSKDRQSSTIYRQHELKLAEQTLLSLFSSNQILSTSRRLPFLMRQEYLLSGEQSINLGYIDQNLLGKKDQPFAYSRKPEEVRFIFANLATWLETERRAVTQRLLASQQRLIANQEQRIQQQLVMQQSLLTQLALIRRDQISQEYKPFTQLISQIELTQQRTWHQTDVVQQRHRLAWQLPSLATPLKQTRFAQLVWATKQHGQSMSMGMLVQRWVTTKWNNLQEQLNLSLLSHQELRGSVAETSGRQATLVKAVFSGTLLERLQRIERLTKIVERTSTTNLRLMQSRRVEAHLRNLLLRLKEKQSLENEFTAQWLQLRFPVLERLEQIEVLKPKAETDSSLFHTFTTSLESKLEWLQTVSKAWLAIQTSITRRMEQLNKLLFLERSRTFRQGFTRGLEFSHVQLLEFSHQFAKQLERINSFTPHSVLPAKLGLQEVVKPGELIRALTSNSLLHLPSLVMQDSSRILREYQLLVHIPRDERSDVGNRRSILRDEWLRRSMLRDERSDEPSILRDDRFRRGMLREEGYSSSILREHRRRDSLHHVIAQIGKRETASLLLTLDQGILARGNLARRGQNEVIRFSRDTINREWNRGEMSARQVHKRDRQLTMEREAQQAVEQNRFEQMMADVRDLNNYLQKQRYSRWREIETRMDYYRPRYELPNSAERVNRIAQQTEEIILEGEKPDLIQELIASPELDKIVDRVYTEIERKLRFERQRMGY